MRSDRSVPTAVCPSDESVAGFVDGSLSSDDDSAMRGHLERCADCRRLVADIGAGKSGPLPSERDLSLAAAAPATRLAARDLVVAPGTIIGGKYRVVRVIGTGGMGKVVAAVHVELKQTVAIKVMHPEVGADTDSVRRFMREGRSAALLKSDHAVRIIDVGRLPSGLPFLVMEHLEGEDLGSLRSKRELSVEEVVDYITQAMTAIGEAHDAGLAHRDIKPQNLFLVRLPDGKQRVKVLDFGLAKELPSIQSTNSALTTDNMLLGSPHYMSPEQIRTPASVDARTDIWALGAAMFKLLTGQPPYISGTVHGLLARILADPVPRVRSLRPDVPVALEEVIARCMEKDLERRFQSVAELAEAMFLAVPQATPSMVLRRTAPATIVDAPRTVVDQDEVTIAALRSAPLPVTLDEPMPPGIVPAPVVAPRAAAPTLLSSPPAAPAAAVSEPQLPARQVTAPMAARPQVAAAAAAPRSRKGWTIAFVVVTAAATVMTLVVVRASRATSARNDSRSTSSNQAEPAPVISVTTVPPLAPPAPPAPPAQPSVAPSAEPPPPKAPITNTRGSATPPTRKPSKPAGAPPTAADDPLYGWGK